MQEFRILSLDGGGIRGVLTATILEEIERKIQGQALKEFFHLIAGTSTGAILAAGIAKGYSAQQLVAIYQNKGKRIFPISRPQTHNRWQWLHNLNNPQYENEGLKDVLQEEFGGNTLLKDLAPNLVLITAYDALNRKPLLMCNWQTEWAYFPIWEACTASASAPTFFPSFKLDTPDLKEPGNQLEINAIDGGVFANNPVTCAVAEAFCLCDHPNALSYLGNIKFTMPDHNRQQFRSTLSVLSIGTGKLTRPIQYKDSKDWGTRQWVAPLIDVMFDGSNAINNQIMSYLIEDHNAYLRLQPHLTKANDDIDDASSENISNLIHLAKEYVQSSRIQDQIDRFLDHTIPIASPAQTISN